MKFINFLNEAYGDDHHYNDYSEDDYSGSGPDYALKSYIKDPGKKRWLDEYEDDLISMYGNDKPEKLYRGLNFDTREDYEEFLHAIDDGKITIENSASSWTRDYQTARQFAKTKPSYMEFMTKEKMKLIDDADKNKEYVVGYRGIILEIDIGKNIGVDTSKTPYAAEDEIIIFSGTYKCICHELTKNSDRIKSDGLEKILDEIEGHGDKEDKGNYNSIMISKIVQDHKDELTPKMKAFFGKRFLKKPPMFYFDYENNKLFDSERDKILVSLGTSPTITYGEEVFNKEDLDKYYKSCYNVHKKKLDELIKFMKKHDGVPLKWNANNPSTWFKQIGLQNEYESIFKDIGKKYNDLNSKKNMDRINKLKGDEQKKAVKDFAQSIKDLIASMG